jgi:hypothetical protein
MAELKRAAPAWDRFAHWPRAAVIAAIAALALVLVGASATYPTHFQGRGFKVQPHVPPRKRDRDLMLYAAIADRVAKGENYYRAAFVEQRARKFPVRPAMAVRLPTFAFLTAWLGPTGLTILAALLVLGITLAWWRRMGEEPGGKWHRLLAVPLMLGAAAYATNPHYSMLHEVWAGLFMTLAFGLHRPGRWWWAWLAAAAAIFIRELALPFVLLLGAMAVWRRDWREAGAWAVLVLLFGGALAWHFHEVSQLWLPSDKPSPPWLVHRGFAGWTSNLVLSSELSKLPKWLAPAVAMLPLLGWAEWRSPAGVTGLLLHAGYGVFFMLAGRDNNFYWGLMLVPTYAIGLAFVPRALWSLGRTALGKT